MTKGNIKRALQFWETMLKCLEALGHTIDIRYHSTYAKLGDHEFKLLLRERCRREIVKRTCYNTSIYHPTGELYFKVDSYPGREWKDGKQPLENQLASILAFLELSGQGSTKLRAQQKEAQEERTEKERIAVSLKRRKGEELESFKTLLRKSRR